MKNISVEESVDVLLNQAKSRAESQLERHKQSREARKKQNRGHEDMDKQISFYEDQIAEIERRMSENLPDKEE